MRNHADQRWVDAVKAKTPEAEMANASGEMRVFTSYRSAYRSAPREKSDMHQQDAKNSVSHVLPFWALAPATAFWSDGQAISGTRPCATCGVR